MVTKSRRQKPDRTNSQLLLGTHGSIAVITFGRPDSLNTLTAAFAEELYTTLEHLGTETRALILTGAGRAFCAGGDIGEMQRGPEAFFDMVLRRLHECVKLIRQAPYPVIAAVNGVAAGAGCNLALACDIVVAAESARFNQAFVKIGLVPDCGGTFFLPRLVGNKRAAELLMTGDFVEAGLAAEMGMINKVVPDADLMKTAFELADRLTKGPARAITATKRLLNQSSLHSLEAQLQLEHAAQLELGHTADFIEGASAFLDKRIPVFTGK